MPRAAPLLRTLRQHRQHSRPLAPLTERQLCVCLFVGGNAREPCTKAAGWLSHTMQRQVDTEPVHVEFSRVKEDKQQHSEQTRQLAWDVAHVTYQDDP